MKEDGAGLWAGRFDTAAVFFGALVPVGIAVGNTGFEAAIGLTGLCWIIRSFLAKKNPFPTLLKHPLLQAWLAWYCCILISLLWNGPGSKGWGHDVVLVRHWLFFAALMDISRRRNVVRPLLIGLGAGILWAAFNALLAYTIGHDLIGKSLARYDSKLKEGERIASFAAYAGPFFLAWALLAKNLLPRKRILLYGIGLIAIVMLVAFHIRTAQIGATAGIMLAGALYLIRRLPLRYAVLLLLLAGLLMGIGVVKYVAVGDLDSMYDRINMWKVAWTMWKAKPILGVSVSGWQDAYRETVDSVLPYVSPDGIVIRSPEAMHAHSLFFQVLSSTGILGSLCFCWLFICIVRILSKNVADWRWGLTPWPAIFLVIGLTGWNIFGSQYLPLFAYYMTLTGISMPPVSPAESR